MNGFQHINLNKCVKLSGDVDLYDYMESICLEERYTYPLDDNKKIVVYGNPGIVRDLSIYIFIDDAEEYVIGIKSAELELDISDNVGGVLEDIVSISEVIEILNYNISQYYSLDINDDLPTYISTFFDTPGDGDDDDDDDDDAMSIANTRPLFQNKNEESVSKDNIYQWEEYIVLVYGNERKYGTNHKILGDSPEYIKTVVINGYKMYYNDNIPYVISSLNISDRIVAEMYKVSYDVFKNLNEFSGNNLKIIKYTDIWMNLYEEQDVKTYQNVTNINDLLEKEYKDMSFSDWYTFAKVKNIKDIADFEKYTLISDSTKTGQSSTTPTNKGAVNSDSNDIYTKEEFALIMEHYTAYRTHIQSKGIQLHPLGSLEDDSRFTDWFISDDAKELRTKLVLSES